MHIASYLRCNGHKSFIIGQSAGLFFSRLILPGISFCEARASSNGQTIGIRSEISEGRGGLVCSSMFISACLSRTTLRTKKSKDAANLADAYDILSILCFESGQSDSRLSVEDKKLLNNTGKDTNTLYDTLYLLDGKVEEVFDIDGPHAAKEAVALLKYVEPAIFETRV